MGEIALWLLVWVPPLFIWTEAKDSFRLPKLMLAGWLALASLAGLAWGLRRLPRVDLRQSLLRPVVLALAPLVLLATLSRFTTEHPLHVQEGLMDFWIGAAALVGWSFALSAERLHRFLFGAWVPAVLLSVVGIAQYHQIWQPLRFIERYAQGRLSVTSYAGNPGDLAAFLVLPCLLLQAQLWSQKRGRAWRVAVLVLIVYTMAVTQSITPMIALAVGSAVLWALLLPLRRSLALLAGGAAVLLVLVAAIAPLRGRVMGKIKDIRQGDLNHLLTGRLDGWRAAEWMFHQHPLVGVGHGAYRASFGEARLALVDRGVKFFKSQDTPVFANAHNEYLELAAEGGLLGLAALAWGLWLLGRETLRIGRHGGRANADPGVRNHRLADRALAWSGLVGLALLALTFFPFRASMIAYPWLIFLAWLFRRAEEEPA